MNRGGAHEQIKPVATMTYIVSGGALNSTHSLTVSHND